MKNEIPDEVIIAGIHAGGGRQEESIRLLYRQCASLITEGRRRYQNLSTEDLESAYHSALLNLRKAVVNQAFRQDSSLKTYLSRIFFNRCIDLLRKQSSVKEQSVAEMPVHLSERPEAIQRLMQEDQFRQAMKWLEELGEPCRQILVDAEYWGYSAEEIAQRIGFSNAASVTSKKYSCLKTLRQRMKAGKV